MLLKETHNIMFIIYVYMLIFLSKFIKPENLKKYQHLTTKSKGIPQDDDITMRHYDVVGESHSEYKLTFS